MKPPSPNLHRAVAPESGERLDKFLSTALPKISRTRAQALMEQGNVTSAGKAITDPSYKIKKGQSFEVSIPPAAAPEKIKAQKIPLDIVYEDEHILVINKQAGLTVHPAPGHADGTLVNALLAHCGKSLSGIGGVARPGIVHRLDKDTSGLMVVAKHDAAHHALSEQLQARTLKRTYLAFCWGTPKTMSGTITTLIGRHPQNRQKMAVLKKGGREAVTHYKVVERYAQASLLECQLQTGRTHQIRVHMTHLGHPIVGDPVYGRSRATNHESRITLKRQALHAWKLELTHPATGEHMEFEAEMPGDMKTLLAQLH